MGSNPFMPLKKEEAPKTCETDYHKDNDKFIIEYGVVQKVKLTGDKATDFIIEDFVEELSRVNRQKSYDSYRNDVGILNIIEKVRLSGDVTLLNQTGRVPMASIEKDVLGHNVEAVVDVTRYQVDQVEALESYKLGAVAFESLDPELKRKQSLEQIAKMSDAEIDAFLAARLPKKEEKEGDK